MAGPLSPQPPDRPNIARILAQGVAWLIPRLVAGDAIERSPHKKGRGIGPETIGDAAAQIGQVLIRGVCNDTDKAGTAQIRALRPLAEKAEVHEKHAEILMHQPLALWTQAIFEYVIREGYLPPPQLLRVVMWTQPSAATSYGVDDSLQTLALLVAEHEGSYALPLAAEPWIHGTAHDPTLISRQTFEKLRQRWRGAPFPESCADTIGLLLDSIKRTRKVVGADASAAYGRRVPLAAGPWRYGAPSQRQWTTASRIAAAGDLPGVLEQITKHEQPGVLMAMVTPDGEQVGSLGDGAEFVAGDRRRVRGQDLLDQLRLGEGVVGDDLDDVEDPAVPAGVRCQRTRGGMVSAGRVRPLLIWRELGRDVAVFAHNFDQGEGNGVLVETARRILDIGEDEGRVACVPRFYDSLGAPFTCQGTSYTTRQALFGLAAMTNVVVVAGTRGTQVG